MDGNSTKGSQRREMVLRINSMEVNYLRNQDREINILIEQTQNIISLIFFIDKII